MEAGNEIHGASRQGDPGGSTRGGLEFWAKLRAAIKLARIKPEAVYGTTTTIHGARLTTFCDTLPSSNPAS